MARRPDLNGHRWRTLRARVLAEEPTCRLQLDDGCTIISTAVDHIIEPDQGGPPRDRTNLQGACKHCNTVKENRRRKQRTSRRW